MKKICLFLLLSLSLPLWAPPESSSGTVDESSSAAAQEEEEGRRFGDLDVAEKGLVDANVEMFGPKVTNMRGMARGASQLGSPQQDVASRIGNPRKLARFLKGAGVSVAAVFVLHSYRRHAETQRKAGKPTILERMWRKVRGLVVRSEKQAA